MTKEYTITDIEAEIEKRETAIEKENNDNHPDKFFIDQATHAKETFERALKFMNKFGVETITDKEIQFKFM